METLPIPEDFLGEKPPSRIIGTESECFLVPDQYDKKSAYISNRAIRRTGHQLVSGYIDNGFYIYKDIAYLETCTPECLGPKQAAAADLAGITLINQVVDKSNLTHGGLYRFSGTSVDHYLSTNGYHENYLIPRSITKNRMIDTVLASHLASRIWAGAGIVDVGFNLYQKSGDIIDPPVNRDVGRRTKEKPMIMIPGHTEDFETLGENEDWARVEVRFADPGFSPTVRYLEFAAASLVLRLVEHDTLVDVDRLKQFSFKNKDDSARLFGRDLTFSETSETMTNGEISAVNYQEILAEACQKLSEEIELPEDECQAIELWFNMIDQLRLADLTQDEYAGLLTLCDFAARYKYLRRSFEHDEIDSKNEEAVKASISWDRISPKGGGMVYWSRILSEYISPDEVQDLLTEPPLTRAYLRGKLIEENYRTLKLAKWSFVRFKNGVKIRFNNPYQSTLN